MTAFGTRSACEIPDHVAIYLGPDQLAELLGGHVQEENDGEGRGQDGVVVQVLPPDAGSIST